MASSKRKFQKKKDREKAVQVKVANRREALQRDRKAARQMQLREIEIEKLVSGKNRPFVNSQQKDSLLDELQDNKIKDQLKHNLEILEALEAEYEAEQRNREKINADLENEGHLTLQEKVKALYEKSLENAEQTAVEQ